MIPVSGSFARRCVPTSDGTTIFHLALADLGIEPVDEVIVPTLTFTDSAGKIEISR